MGRTAIITAGGTVESIDDVRLVKLRRVLGGSGDDITELTRLEVENISKGSFGRAIAEAFVRKGIETTLIGKDELIRRIGSESQGMRLVPFRSVNDLQTAIEEEVARVRPDFFLMAAAVSDYSPVAFEGKLSSAPDEITIRMRKSPKLLDGLRKRVGPDCLLTGFKLVSGLTPVALNAIAQKQNDRAGLNLTVGNDLKQIDFARGIHPITIVRPEGEPIALSGKRPYVAERLVSTLCDIAQ